MNRKERRQQQRMAKKGGVSPLRDPAMFQQALSLHQAGQFPEAVQLYNQILAAQGDHGETLNLCGAATFALGNLPQAVVLLKRAAGILPGNADVWFNLGNAFHASGMLEDSAQAYGKAAALSDGQGGAHFNHGVVLQSLGRLDESAAAYRKAVKVAPEDAEAWNNLGNVLADLDAFDEARDAFEKAVALKPGSTDALANLGNLLQRASKPEEAAAAYRRALALGGQNPRLWNNLGDALCLTGDFRAAKDAYVKAVDLMPEFPEALSSLAYAHQELGESEEARQVCRQVIAVAPDRPEGFGNLANLLQEDGEMAQAETFYRQALGVDPGYTQSYRQLSSLKKFKSGDEDIEKMEGLLGQGDVSEEQKIHLFFALSKAYDDLADYDRAFSALEKGNRLQRQSYDFDISRMEEMAARITETFDEKFIKERAGNGNVSGQGVFIIGMPRSGSTLIEQILSSHSQVYGAGESDALPRVIDSFSQETAYPQSVLGLKGHDFKDLGKRYLEFIGDQGAQSSRIIDKTLSNFLHVGLIALMFPEAKIIHSKRDPMDTCLSCFRLYFTSYQPFTYDLGELGRYFKIYQGMMDHWRSVLPDSVLDLDYEALIEDQEGESRRLIEFCGLDWEAGCLDFHKNKRTVRTLSVSQVRKPIFKSSLGRWRNYEKHLEPLVKEIGKGAQTP